MAIASYSDLLASISAYTKRGDTASLAPTWIALAETRMSRELRSAQMLVRATLSVSTETVTAPADCMALRSARLSDSPYTPLDVLNPEQMAERKAEQPSGPMSAVSLVGTTLWFSPAPTAATNVEVLYYGAIPALTAMAPTNWVITLAPDLYLWGCLTEAADFYEDDQQLQKYSARFSDAVAGENLRSAKSEASFTPTPIPSAWAV